MDCDDSAGILVPKKEDDSLPTSAQKPASQCTRPRVTFSLVMFLCSFANLGSLAYYSLLKDKLSLNPAELNAYYTFIMVMPMIKPVYGFITDSCYICGRHRQPYIVLGGIVIAGMWILIAYAASNAVLAALFMAVISGSVSLVNSACQGLAIEDSQSRTDPKAYEDSKTVKNVSLVLMMGSVGLLCSSYFSGLIVHLLPLRTNFLITAAIPTLIALCGFALRESTC